MFWSRFGDDRRHHVPVPYENKRPGAVSICFYRGTEFRLMSRGGASPGSRVHVIRQQDERQWKKKDDQQSAQCRYDLS